MNKLGSCDVVVFLRHKVSLNFKGRRIFYQEMLCLSISILTLALRLMNDDHMMKLNSCRAFQNTIIMHPLDCRSELLMKCRHRKKFLLSCKWFRNKYVILNLQSFSQDVADNVSHPRRLDPIMELTTYSFVLYLQHGRHDVKCKPSIYNLLDINVVSLNLHAYISYIPCNEAHWYWNDLKFSVGGVISRNCHERRSFVIETGRW